MRISKLNKCIWAFVLFLAVLALGETSATAQSDLPDPDFQVWNTTTLIVPIIKKQDEKSGKEYDRLAFVLSGDFRFGQNRLHPVDDRYLAGFAYKPTKPITIASAYMFRRGEAIRGAIEYEHRIRFDITLEKNWSKFSLKEMNRIDYRIRNSRPNGVRYQRKTTLRIPVKREGKELFAPFVAEELFYDFPTKKWIYNHLHLGVNRKLTKNISTDLFYIWKHNWTDPIKTINGVGINFQIRID